LKPVVAPNRTIVVMAEGDTERAARPHLKRFLDERAGVRPKVRLQVTTFDRALKEADVRGRAEKFLSDPNVIGVIALLDVYPQFKGDLDSAKKTVSSWMPKDPRCHVHFAKHDFEAWLLLGWEAILKQSGVKSGLKPWGPRPEEINRDKPPAHRLSKLFQQGDPPRKYKKPIDGKKLFERLDLTQVAAACPEFKAFLNALLTLAKYDPLP
jgi:Domain of unknown function (DUF4276)